MASRRRKTRYGRTVSKDFLETAEETAYRHQRLRLFLRTLLYAGGLRGFCRDLQTELCPAVNAIVAPLDLPPIDFQDNPARTLDLVRQTLQACLEAVEADIPSLPEDAFSRNLRAVADTLALSSVEAQVLQMVVMVTAEEGLSHTLGYLGDLNQAQVCRAMARILDLPLKDVEKALSRDNLLISSGLLVFSPEKYSFPYKIAPMEGLSDDLHMEYEDPMELFSRYARPAQKAVLSKSDFRHLGSEFNLIKRLIAPRGAEKGTGINILLYGPPGTGKTEMARAVAAAAQIPLYEVACKANNGSPLQAEQRIAQYRFAQALLRQRGRCAILFDEVEEVFLDTGNPLLMLFSCGVSPPGGNKACVNATLETNPIPSIWVANRIGHMDPAYLRRFTHVLEVRIPPPPVRRAIVKRYVSGMNVRPEWVDRIAAVEAISPAHIESAAAAVRKMNSGPPGNAEKTMERILRNKIIAAGLKWTPPPSTSFLPRYELRFLNASTDLELLTEGLKTCREARVCLYGPPGTGKSALAPYLAKQLEVSLVRKLGSDLLSPYIGVTEMLIARMFEEARAEGAILLLDEADGFLQDRSYAERSWEVTQVNELLTQMESFEGIFVCSTNMMSRLDPASLRRFDLKVAFDYLKPDQAWRFFEACLAQCGGRPAGNDPSLRTQLTLLRNLTPGDFTAVLRQCRALGTALTADFLLDGLKKESAAKQCGRRSISGFVS